MSRRQAKREKREREQWAGDLAWLMGEVRGRRIVANLLARAAVGQNVFTGNSHGNYLQGRQSLGNELAAEIKLIALADFHRMEVEVDAAQRIAAQDNALLDDDSPDA